MKLVVNLGMFKNVERNFEVSGRNSTKKITVRELCLKIKYKMYNKIPNCTISIMASSGIFEIPHLAILVA